MGELVNIVTPLHVATSRDYLERMINDKVTCMKVAKRYDQDYWDGDRRFGYGGYRYIPGRWKPVAEALIKRYGLIAGSKVLDAGCGKGYLLYEMTLIEPGLEITGFDISEYALENAKEEIRENLLKHAFCGRDSGFFRSDRSISSGGNLGRFSRGTTRVS